MTGPEASDGQQDSAYGPVRRKEDARFLFGHGSYLDDFQLKVMV